MLSTLNASTTLTSKDDTVSVLSGTQVSDATGRNATTGTAPDDGDTLREIQKTASDLNAFLTEVAGEIDGVHGDEEALAQQRKKKEKKLIQNVEFDGISADGELLLEVLPTREPLVDTIIDVSRTWVRTGRDRLSTAFLDFVQTPAVQGVLLHAVWYVVCDERGFPDDERHTRLLYHNVAMHYGAAFAAQPVGSPAEMRAKDELFAPLPTFTAMLIHKVLCGAFRHQAKEFGTAFRGRLVRQLSRWMFGIEPQIVDTAGWGSEGVREEPKLGRTISQQRLWDDLQKLRGERRRSSITTGRRISAPKQPKMVMANITEVCDPEVVASITFKPKRSKSVRIATPEQFELPKSLQHHLKSKKKRRRPRREVEVKEFVPTLHSGANKWYEQGKVIGHACMERAEDEKETAEKGVLSSVQMSPLMQHYTEHQRIPVKVLPARRIEWTSLSQMDQRNMTPRFSQHADRVLGRVRDGAVDEAGAAKSYATFCAELKSEAHREQFIEESKMRRIKKILDYHYSPRNPTVVAKMESLLAALKEALQEKARTVREVAQQYEAALLRLDNEILSLPLVHRQPLNEVGQKCFARLKLLQRQAPERSKHEHVFSDQQRAQLDVVYTEIQGETREDLADRLDVLLGIAKASDGSDSATPGLVNGDPLDVSVSLRSAAPSATPVSAALRSSSGQHNHGIFSSTLRDGASPATGSEVSLLPLLHEDEEGDSRRGSVQLPDIASKSAFNHSTPKPPAHAMGAKATHRVRMLDLRNASRVGTLSRSPKTCRF